MDATERHPVSGPSNWHWVTSSYIHPDRAACRSLSPPHAARGFRRHSLCSLHRRLLARRTFALVAILTAPEPPPAAAALITTTATAAAAALPPPWRRPTAALPPLFKTMFGNIPGFPGFTQLSIANHYLPLAGETYGGTVKDPLIEGVGFGHGIELENAMLPADDFRSPAAHKAASAALHAHAFSTPAEREREARRALKVGRPPICQACPAAGVPQHCPAAHPRKRPSLLPPYPGWLLRRLLPCSAARCRSLPSAQRHTTCWQ